ncbi:hypothetical protein [Streptomyces sp. NPDC056660]|uniref:hypothetical protein n=1 Tax=Streptomyces sp. NPDC056660 TaxID=3345897 RepID=UPI003673C5D1
MARTAQSQTVRQDALTAAHIADARLAPAQDATITATMTQNVGPPLTSLQPAKDAVVRTGAVLAAKADWEVRVLQLTAAQQAIPDHQQQLATSPRDVISAIGPHNAPTGRTTADSTARTARSLIQCCATVPRPPGPQAPAPGDGRRKRRRP